MEFSDLAAVLGSLRAGKADVQFQINSRVRCTEMLGMSIQKHDKGSQVAILLCTYNGEKYLKNQLDSIARQTYKHWAVYASDDGSVDNTRKILQEFSASYPEHRVEIYDGPQEGFAKNFYSLLQRKEVIGDYYAFCDQDDIWDVDKLEVAVGHMLRIGERVPALVCGRTRYVNNDLQPIGYSPLFEKKPSFRNALVQSIAGGNTMLINSSARRLVCMVGRHRKIVSHDWMCYLIVSASGGVVYYDPIPRIGYRQHELNLVGANSSVKERIARLKGLFKGTFKEWNELNIELLADVLAEMHVENKRVFEYFCSSRRSLYPGSLYYALKSGVYRQTIFGNIGLAVAYLLRKI